MSKDDIRKENAYGQALYNGISDAIEFEIK